MFGSHNHKAKVMSNLIVLDGIELIPVVELEPATFSTKSRNAPSNSSWEVPEAWFRYWSDSLADSGIRELRPVRHGSWHVPTVNFTATRNLQLFLEKTFQQWGGIESLSDPENRPVFYGGLALRCSASGVLIEPSCCSELETVNDWKEAAVYKGETWRDLWIGHPWLSVRYESPLLILSEPHESNTPSERWAVNPDELDQNTNDAKVELVRFANEVANLLPALGCPEDPIKMSRKLAGLA
jgi:hypothetical protein